MGTRRLRLASSHWLLLLLATTSTALVGCRSNQRAQTNTPAEKVAGSRQEDETTRILQQASLPETFAFGGRTWRAHQVHWVDQIMGSGNVPTTSGTDGAAGTTGTMPEQSRPSAKSNVTPSAPATTSGSASVPGAGSAASSTTGERAGMTQPGAVGNFVPVAHLQVQGHQIYRQIGADEAFTDNIFLKAENVSAGAAGTASDTAATGTGVGTTGTAGPASTNAAENNANTGTAHANRVAFIEYEASGEPMANLELPQVLPAAGLPQTVKLNGKMLTAQELQVYDADVFSKLKPLVQMVDGHRAFQGEDKNSLYLMSEGPVNPSGSAPGSGNTPGTSGTSTGTDTATERGASGTGTEAGSALQGPIFIRYEMVASTSSGSKSR